DLAHPVHAIVVGAHLPDPGGGGLVGARAQRRSPVLGRVVGGRGGLQHLADRLDPEFLPVQVDVGHYLVCGRSSSAAKKADADLRIALARRSSRFSRSSSAIVRAWSVVVPGRVPSSISAWLTQLRRVSRLTPSWSPIRAIAPGRVAGSRRASTAIRIARSRSSGGYFLGAGMTLILPRFESLHHTRHETHRLPHQIQRIIRTARAGEQDDLVSRAETLLADLQHPLLRDFLR